MGELLCIFPCCRKLKTYDEVISVISIDHLALALKEVAIALS